MGTCWCGDTGFLIMNVNEIQRCDTCHRFGNDIDAAIASGFSFTYDAPTDRIIVEATPEVQDIINRQNAHFDQ